MPEIDCAAELLKDVAGPVMQDGRIRITSQACPKLPYRTGPLPLPRKREDLPDLLLQALHDLARGYRS
jgi:hypothetical protein